MPLKPGSSQKTISDNIKELMDTKPTKARAKGIATLAKRRGITPQKAKQKQAIAIAMTKARASKRKKK